MSFPLGSVLDPNQRISVNINGGSYSLWDEGRREMYAHSGSKTQKAVWTCVCLWEQRVAIAAALLGGSTNVAGTAIFVNGAVYPDNPAWVVQTVETVPDGLQSQYVMANQQPTSMPAALITFQRARLTVTFGVPEFVIGQPNNVGEEELDFSANAVCLPNEEASFKWTSGPKSGDDLSTTQTPTINITTVKFNKSIYNRPMLNVPLFGSLVDHVNSASIFGAAAGSLLFRGARSRRKITAAGVMNWDIDLSFEWMCGSYGNKVAGWNKQWQTGSGFEDFVCKTTNVPLFPSGNLSLLFA